MGNKIRKKTLILGCGLLLFLLLKSKERNRAIRKNRNKGVRKKYWVNELVKTRCNGSIHQNLLNEMRFSNESMFKNFVRMNYNQFEELLKLVAPNLLRESTIREVITPAERLSLTLR